MPSDKAGATDLFLRRSTTVFALLIAAKLFNLVKKILVGKLFGISSVADVFFAASYLPYCAAVFFEGVIYLGFLPLFSKIMLEKGREEANRFLGNALPVFLILTTGLAVIAWLWSPWVVQQLVPGFKPEQQDLTVQLFRIMILVIVFISLCSFFQALNSYYGRYFIAASSGLTDTLVMIVILLATYRIWGIYGAAWAAIISAGCAVSFQILSLWSIPQALPNRLLFQPRVFIQLFSILLPMCAIWGLKQIPIIILNRFGSGMWQGTISAFAISLGLMIVPTALVSQTVLICIFPSLAKQISDSTTDDAQKIFSRTLRAAFFILVPLGFLMCGLARPIAVIFFSGNGIVYEGTRRIANTLTCFGWAAFVFYADIFMTQFLIAARKIKTAIFLGASRAVLTYGLGYYFIGFLDYKGLALSFSLALVINFYLMFPLFFRSLRTSEDWKSLCDYSWKLTIASIPALIIGVLANLWPLYHWLEISRWWVLLIGLVFVVLSLSLFLYILSCFKLEELNSAIENVKSLWAKRSFGVTRDTNERPVNADVFNDENL